MTIEPVTNDERSDARKIAGPTISSGLPVRPSGVWSRNIFTSSGLVARTFSFSGVSMKPGPMALNDWIDAILTMRPLAKRSLHRGRLL